MSQVNVLSPDQPPSERVPLDAAPVDVGARRVVFQTTEYSDVAIPIEHILTGQKLDIYPELTSTSVLKTYSKEGRLYFQAGGLIGLLPINDRVALEISPRVPIRNLERILYIAENSSPLVLKGHLGNFSHTNDALPASLLNVLADRFIDLIEACWNEGLHSDYVLRRRTGQNPAGRLIPLESRKYRRRTRDLTAAVSEQFERTHDTAANRCLAAAADVLYSVFSGIRDKKEVRQRTSRLGRARMLLASVPRSVERGFLQHSTVVNPSSLPSARPSYPYAVALAKVILAGQGIELRGRGGLSLPPMVISMENAFESYLRNVLASRKELIVKDGNKGGDFGARRTLFHATPQDSPAKSSHSTPDIVCLLRERESVSLIIEVKYKPEPDRNDYNQALGYALTFKTDTVVLASPRKSSAAVAGLRLVGSVGHVSLYSYAIDLDSPSLQEEELKFIAEIEALLVAKAATN